MKIIGIENPLVVRVREASDGFGAFAEMRSEVPDILISDLNMPAMSGSNYYPLCDDVFRQLAPAP